MSKTIGGVSEIAVLSPILKGCVPGERRTYEERLRAVIDNLAGRHRQGIPIELNSIPAIHFGRLTIVRPEQYLLNSFVHDIAYFEADDTPTDGTDAPPSVATAAGPDAAAITEEPAAPPPSPRGYVPKPIEDFPIGRRLSAARARLRSGFSSFLLTQVAFDGDLKVYMRDIAEYLAGDFDRIFENCDDFPGTTDVERFWLWIRRYQINTDLFYAPYSNLSVVRIKHLEAFKRRFDAFVATVRPGPGQQAPGLDALFDAFLRENQQIARDFPMPSGLFTTNPNGGRTPA